jgi:hypothetical protein
MGPRSAALLALVILIGLGGWAGWMVGIPGPALIVMALLTLLFGMRRIARRLPTIPKPATAPKQAAPSNPE